MIRVLIADDHALVREGTRQILSLEPDIEVVAEAADGDAAVELTARLAPDVMVMDIGMPEVHGIQATQQIKQAVPETACAC